MIAMNIQNEDEFDNDRKIEFYLGMEISVYCNFSAYYFAKGYRIAHQVISDSGTSYWREYICKSFFTSFLLDFD